MNKYLAGFLNILIGLAIIFVGLLFTLNFAVAGFILFPMVVGQVDQLLVSSPPMWWEAFVPGTLSLCFLVAHLSFVVLFVYKTVGLAMKVDVAKVIKAMELKGNVKQKKEASGVVNLSAPYTQ